MVSQYFLRCSNIDSFFSFVKLGYALTMMILSLDYGERYVGLAITDPDGKIALRHGVIDQGVRSSKKKAPDPLLADPLSAIEVIVKRENVELVLVGLPIGLSGEETGQTRTTQEFVEQLREKLGEDIKIETIDERFSSKEAEQRVLGEGGKKEDAHSEAARLLLEDYLRRPS